MSEYQFAEITDEPIDVEPSQKFWDEFPDGIVPIRETRHLIVMNMDEPIQALQDTLTVFEHENTSGDHSWNDEWNAVQPNFRRKRMTPDEKATAIQRTRELQDEFLDLVSAYGLSEAERMTGAKPSTVAFIYGGKNGRYEAVSVYDKIKRMEFAIDVDGCTAEEASNRSGMGRITCRKYMEARGHVEPYNEVYAQVHKLMRAGHDKLTIKAKFREWQRKTGTPWHSLFAKR